MPGSTTIKVGYADWSRDADANSASAPTDASDGVNISLKAQSKDVHVLIDKTSSVDLQVWARGNGRWAVIDRVQLAESAREGQRYEALTAYDGVAVRRLDTNAQTGNTINAWIGLSEG